MRYKGSLYTDCTVQLPPSTSVQICSSLMESVSAACTWSACPVYRCSFLHLILLFWNQILTCVSDRFNSLARRSLSVPTRYCCRSNADSSRLSWSEVNIVRLRRFFVSGLSLNPTVRLPEKKRKNWQHSYITTNALIEVNVAGRPVTEFGCIFDCVLISVNVAIWEKKMFTHSLSTR